MSKNKHSRPAPDAKPTPTADTSKQAPRASQDPPRGLPGPVVYDEYADLPSPEEQEALKDAREWPALEGTPHDGPPPGTPTQMETTLITADNPTDGDDTISDEIKAEMSKELDAMAAEICQQIQELPAERQEAELQQLYRQDQLMGTLVRQKLAVLNNADKDMPAQADASSNPAADDIPAVVWDHDQQQMSDANFQTEWQNSPYGELEAPQEDPQPSLAAKGQKILAELQQAEREAPPAVPPPPQRTPGQLWDDFLLLLPTATRDRVQNLRDVEGLVSFTANSREELLAPGSTLGPEDVKLVEAALSKVGTQLRPSHVPAAGRVTLPRNVKPDPVRSQAHQERWARRFR